MVDGLVDARNWETQTLAAAAMGTEGIARMLENRETQTGGGGEGGGGEGGGGTEGHSRSGQPILFGKP